MRNAAHLIYIIVCHISHYPSTCTYIHIPNHKNSTSIDWCLIRYTEISPLQIYAELRLMQIMPLHDDAATFQFAYNAWEIPFDGCFNLSVLLLLLMVSAMMLLLLTRIASLATVVLLTLMLLPMVSTVARPISTTILMRELWWHLRRATLKINIYSACVALCGILQSHFPADLLDAWLDFLDMIGRMISFSYNTIGPKKHGSALHCFKSS